MLAEGERVAFGDDDAAVFIVCSEEVLHHRESLGGGDDGRRLVGVHEGGDIARMVRLHVVDDQIVGGLAAEHVFDVAEPFVTEADIDRVNDGGLAVEDGVRIVSHAVGDDVLAFEKVDFVVVDADVPNVFGDVHDNLWCFFRLIKKFFHK